MKVWTHLYTIENSNNKHQGVLFKFEFNDQMTGYGDLHPWPELGDPTIAEQLALVKKGEFPPAFRKTMLHAQIDAQARLDKKSVFEGLQIPRSHFFASRPELIDQILMKHIYDQGFKSIKLKVADLEAGLKDVIHLVKLINKWDIKLRIDFNAKFKRDDVFTYLHDLKFQIGHLNFVDFVEDPISFEEKDWSDLKKTFSLNLALDRELANVPSNLKLKLSTFADIIVFKPALQLVEEVSQLAKMNGLKMVVTTNLDHALGVMSAAWEAALLHRKHPEMLKDCGLISHQDFRDDGFFSKIQVSGPQLIPPTSPGFGFEHELAARKWEYFL